MCGHIEAAKAVMEACKGLDKSQTEPGLYDDSHANDASVLKQLSRPDPSSFANFDVVKVLNYHLDLVTDFDSSTMSGSCTYTLSTVVANAGVAVFDIRDINVKSAHIVTGSKDVAGVLSATEWWITRKNAKLGQALVVRLPAGLPASTTIEVKVEYTSSPEASAVQWLTPEQTVGKEHPYIFTQCQAIHARSLLPCMDSPGIKSTYTAALTVPAPLQALMSAILVDEKPVTTEVNGKPHNQWKFDQRIPIPIYLIAILVGNLQKRDLSHRCAVWSEPEVVDKAAWEFVDLEKIVATAESICGPYEWGRYDIAVLPGSFPYGGMESQMTFLTPSLVAGDRSLVNVLAHEAAHSWSGNLVTNNDWQSFFLNEGFTVFVERKILEALDGIDFKGLHTMIGWEDLKQSIADFSAPDKVKYTALFIDMSDDADPDDAFSSVPYEKGFAMLSYLEKLVGGSTVMNPFLKAYFANFKYQSISAQQFQAFFLEYMLSQGVDKATLDTIDWVTWFTGYGLPPKPDFSDVLAREATSLSNALVADADLPAPETVKMSEWSSAQRTVFLDRLIEMQEDAITAAEDKKQVQQTWGNILDNTAKYFDYNTTQNAELLFRWLTLQVRAAVPDVEPKVAKLLTTYGRMKFTRPLYRDMFKSEKYREFGQKLFIDNKSFYHNICAAMVAKDREDAIQKAYVW